jgi:MFS family permease
MPPIVRALAHRNYRIYFSGQLVALTGTWMQQMALIWLTYRITNSTFMLGLITFAGQVPLLVLSPLGGVLSDRFERRTLLLWTQWLALVQASLLALLAFTVPLQAWMLIVLALCLGLINAIDQPVRQSFVAELVDRPEDIANAVALNSVTIHSTRFVVPRSAVWS